jgi:hypothetical protein
MEMRAADPRLESKRQTARTPNVDFRAIRHLLIPARHALDLKEVLVQVMEMRAADPRLESKRQTARTPNVDFTTIWGVLVSVGDALTLKQELVQVMGLRAAYPRLEIAGKQGVHLCVLGEQWAPHEQLGKQAAGAPNVNFCPIWHLLIPVRHALTL